MTPLIIMAGRYSGGPAESRQQPLYLSGRGGRPVTIPKHEPIKKAYVEMVKKITESEVDTDDTE